MKISFCTTVMGRLHHLKETLFKNLEYNKDHQDLEIVILDYNSQDGLESWVKANVGDLIEAGKVVYWREQTATRWNMPHAKNLAHLLATGDVLCNVDADNVCGQGYASALHTIFSSHPASIVTHIHGGGFGGRVALRKGDFLQLRGYDEELSYGWGWEDDDLKIRSVAAGLAKTELQMEGDSAIPHDNEERIKFMPEWKSVVEAHCGQSVVFAKRSQGTIINPKGFGKGVVRNFEITKEVEAGSGLEW